uniref:Origin recognition complex subunit 2 n=1 Tax=Noctiluca scintillans TaxID=2966 RepID=A0A7S1A8C5_NOCSC
MAVVGSALLHHVILTSQPATPPKRLAPECYSDVHELRKPRKVRRRIQGFSVLEGASKPAPEMAEGTPLDGTCSAKVLGPNNDQKQPTSHRGKPVDLPCGFAEDYFRSQNCAKPAMAFVDLAAIANSESVSADPTAPETENSPPVKEPQDNVYGSWLQTLQVGFSLLVSGVGSKRSVLNKFSDEVLLPWGASVVVIEGNSSRFSLVECLRDVLDQLHPGASRCGNSTGGLVGAIRVARRSCPKPRPLCLVVHNLEVLQPANQSTLAKLASSPGVHLIASVDNMWAPLTWDPQCLQDFNFCREEVHTHEGYDFEVAMRYQGNFPAWSGLGEDRKTAPKASLKLVLQSLTNNHRELVQALAECQLSEKDRCGISQSALLTISSERMIAANTARLKNLLNELQSHDIVMQRPAANGGMLFYLNLPEKALRSLAEDATLDDSDEEGEDSDAM